MSSDYDSTDVGSIVRTRGAGGLPGVTFWPKTRTRLALAYHLLKSAELHADGRVSADFGEVTVTIHGSGLEQLAEDLILRKVVRVAATPRTGRFAGGGVVEEIVERIDVQTSVKFPPPP